MSYEYFTSWKQGAFFDYSEAVGTVVLITHDQTTTVYDQVTDVNELLRDEFSYFFGSCESFEEFRENISVKVEQGRAMSKTVAEWLSVDSDFKAYRRNRQKAAESAFRVGEDVSWDHKGQTEYGRVVKHLPGGGFMLIQTTEDVTRRVSIGNVVEKMFPDLHEEYNNDDD